MAPHLCKPLQGRPILEALGLITRDLLASAAGRLAGNIDSKSLVGSFVAEGDGRLACVMEGVFHAHGGEIGCEDDDGSSECCVIGSKTDEEREKCFKGKIAFGQTK